MARNTSTYPWPFPAQKRIPVLDKIGGGMINDIRQSPWQWLDQQEKGPLGAAGKILRKLLRSIADGENFQIPSTIDDEAIIGEVREVLELAKIGSFK